LVAKQGILISQLVYLGPGIKANLLFPLNCFCLTCAFKWILVIKAEFAFQTFSCSFLDISGPKKEWDFENFSTEEEAIYARF
jgi:hypothetical protein